MESPLDITLRHVFSQGLGKQPRAHQLSAVSRQIEAIERGGVTRFLHQHAPGSGKTEVIALLAVELIRRRSFDAVVILNYATELEEQMERRAREFWDRAGWLPSRRAGSTKDVQQAVPKGSVLFALLQKFPEDAVFSPQPGEVPSRFCVIIDEAHRGVPDEGVHIQSVLRRFGAEQTQIYFTATPKAETLLSHGKLEEAGPRGKYHVAFHVHTQSDAVKERYTLNPLEKYVNSIAGLTADGDSLVNLGGKCTMSLFADRLHRQRPKQMVSQQASFILDHLDDVVKEMPVMRQQGHQIKHLVVAPTQQAVYNLGEQLRKLAAKRNKPLVVGVFFSGTVQTANGKPTRDRAANGDRRDAEMLDVSDVIVCCSKFLAGWDEWRVCSVFLCRRVLSEEFLQQMLARATRARPGNGKRRPLIFDLANHPDDVCAAVARFWKETRHFEGEMGEVVDLADRIKADFGGAMTRPAPEVVARLSGSDQVLLRATVVRYYRAAAPFAAAELPLCFDQLFRLLLELNLALCQQLFAGDRALAKSEAEQAAALRSGIRGEGGSEANVQLVRKTVPAALRHLRTALKLGRARRPRTGAAAPTTPAKRRAVAAVASAAGDDPAGGLVAETPEKTTAVEAELPSLTSPSPAPPSAKKSRHDDVDLRAIKEHLKLAVSDVSDRFWNGLPDEGDADTPDTRETELRAFRFAAYPLRRFGAASHNAVTNAERSLKSKLNNCFGDIMKDHWSCQRTDLVQKMEEAVQGLRDEHGSTPSQQLSQGAAEAAEEIEAELGEILGAVTGHAAAWQRRKLRKSLEELLPSPPRTATTPLLLGSGVPPV